MNCWRIGIALINGKRVYIYYLGRYNVCGLRDKFDLIT